MTPPRETNGGRLGDRDLDVGGHQLAGLLRARARPEQHVTGHHGRGRARARLEQAALGQQAVQAHTRHRPTVPVSALTHERPFAGHPRSDMKFLRRISLPAHALVELTVGLALVVAPFVLTLGGIGTVLMFAAGVVLAGIGLGAVDALPLAAHQSLDRLLATALAVASIVACARGRRHRRRSLLLTGAVLMLALAAATRWTRTPVAPAEPLPRSRERARMRRLSPHA